MRKYDVYGIGNALVDIEFEVEDDFFITHKVAKGMMTLVDEERQHLLVNAIKAGEVKKQSGGSAANTIIAVNQFGGKSFYSCKVANDDFGRFYMDDLKASGVDTNLNGFDLEEGITGKCLVMVTPDADRTMNTFLGITSALSVAAINEEALANSSYLYIEGYLVTGTDSLNAMKEAKRIAEKHQVKTSITLSDPSIVQHFGTSFKDVIGSGVDLLFCNEEEAFTFTGKSNLLEAREELKYVAKSFAITLGKNGAMIFDGDTFIEIESFPVEAVDTNGAGDMFAGAFLYGLTHGHSHAQAGKIASMASSKVVAKFGPRLEWHQAKGVLNHIFQVG
jgi:sugar/nucleoside kinase (ribokinase family)